MALSSLYLELTVDGDMVLGESQTEFYRDQIELESFEWSVDVKHTEKDTEKIDGEVRPKAVVLAKVFDRSSGLLCRLMAERTAFSRARVSVLSMALQGKATNPKMMEMTLNDGFIESVSLTAAESGKAIGVKEKVTLSFRSCRIVYFAGDTGRQMRGTAMTFDLEQPSIKG